MPPSANFFQSHAPRLIDNGYLVVPISAGAKYPKDVRAWQQLRLSKRDVASYTEPGVGILTGVGQYPIVAFDIDASCPELSTRFAQWCLTHLGPAPVRVGREPRQLLVYTTSTSGGRKTYSGAFEDLFGEAMKLEVLNAGQQFVAHHIHPDTQKPYRWVAESLLDVSVESLVELSPEQIAQAVEMFEQIATELGYGKVAESSYDKDRRLAERGPQVRDEGTDPIERVRKALEAVPVPAEHDPWVTLGMAIHEATGGSDEGLALWHEHSRQGHNYDARTLDYKWRSFSIGGNRGAAITRAYLYRQALDHGWHDGAAIDTEGFEDVPVAQIESALAMSMQDDLAALSKRREALERLRAESEAAEDTIYLKAKVAPTARKILLDFPELKGEVVALFKARSKELGAPLDAKELTRVLSGPHVPTVKTARPLTEFGNAERMLDKFGDGLMYVPEIAAWYIWTGIHWRKASDVEIEHCAKETVRDLVNEVDDVESDKLGDFFEFCRQSQRAVMVRNMVSLAASDPRVMVPAKELDKHSHYLGVKNGVVDLKTGALLPPDPALRITIVAGADYKPNAKCPLFQQTVSDVFSGDRDMAEYLLTAFGYALCGKPVEDKLFIAFGDGSNGKSTVFNTVRKVFGGYAKSADAGSFISDGKSGGAGGAREDLVRLLGARFVYVNEPDENGELREGTVKSMTGGDAITARGLYAKTSMEFDPTWVVFMPTNHKPIIKGTDHGIWRRLDLLPFERNFDKDPNVVKDPKREEKLEAEKEGVLALLVRYAMRYQNDGLVQPAKVKAARESYRSNMDLLAEWLEECCEIGDGLEEPTQRLWVSWENWAKNRGLLRYVSSSLQLSRRLDSRFPAKKGGKGLRLRLGLRLKDDFA